MLAALLQGRGNSQHALALYQKKWRVNALGQQQRAHLLKDGRALPLYPLPREKI